MPNELPKALSADRRDVLEALPSGRMALALIDAQAALLAEYAAQAVVDGSQRDDLFAACVATGELAARAERAEARIAELEAQPRGLVEMSERLAKMPRLIDLDRIAELERTEQYLRDDCDRQIANARADRAVAESKLAAANALLREWVDCVGQYPPMGATLAHLAAAQPAAPALDEGPESCMSPYRENYDLNVPARTEAVFEVQGRSWPAGTYPTRAEAEQAVLDAMRNVNTAWLEEVRDTSCGPLGAACRAELARRGLK